MTSKATPLGPGLLLPTALSPPPLCTHLPPNCPNRNLLFQGGQSLTVPHLHTSGCSPPPSPSPFSHRPRLKVFKPAVSQTPGHRGHGVLHPCSPHSPSTAFPTQPCACRGCPSHHGASEGRNPSAQASDKHTDTQV